MNAIVWLRSARWPHSINRGLNRSENLRLFAPGEEDFERLAPRRSDIEANNRQLEDTLWINRAHSKGAKAQLLDLLGCAIVYNAIAVGLTAGLAPAPRG